MCKKVFNEQFNFSFHLPSKDACENVMVFKNHLLLQMMMKEKILAALSKSLNFLLAKKQGQSLCYSYRKLCENKF